MLFGLHDDLDSAIAERKAIRENLYKTQLEYVPGFIDFFATLQPLGIKTIIATGSSQRFLQLIEEKLHLLELFDNHIVTVDDVQHSKPAPDIFLEAANRLAIPAENCLVIEDSPNGILAARAAGMPVIAMTTTFTAHFLADTNPTYIVASYTEIPALLQPLFASL